MKKLNDVVKSQAYFKSSIQMALGNKFPWTTLALTLDQMTPTLNQSKELVKVLLSELQSLQEKHQELLRDKAHSNEDDNYQNDVIEALEEESVQIEFEQDSILEIKDQDFEENSQQDSKDVQVIQS